jgi:hypothetical protein
MAASPKVQDLIDAFEMQNDECAAFLDRGTGEIHVISHDTLRMAEDETDVASRRHGWEKEELELARRVLESDRYVELPTSRDVHEWGIMEEFCYALDDGGLRADFLAAIQGRGAFRYFRDLLFRHGLRDSWYAFRAEALRKIALEWCEENEIALQT